MEVRNLAAVGLSLLLVANCFMPCYTLAYADESTDGGVGHEQLREDQQECAGDGQADQGSDFQGVLRYEVPEKTSPGSELFSVVGISRTLPSSHVLVEASYGLADSLIRLASARAYADESQEVEGVPEEEQEEIAGDAAGFELSPGVGEFYVNAADGGAAAEGHGDDFGASEETGEDSPGLDAGLGDEGNFFKRVLGSLDDITYILGEIADYYRQGQGGIQPLADDVYHQILGAIQTTNSKIDSLNAVALGSSAASNRFKWTVNGTVFNTSRGGLAWIAAYAVAILADIQSYTKSSSTSLSNLVSYATSVASDGNYYSFTKYLNMIYYQQQKQWGYGYGGTAVITNNSPASWLQTLSSNSVSTASDGKSYSFAKYLNMINSHMGDLVTNVGWPYNGTSVTGFLNVINTEANNQSKTLEAIRKLLLSQNQNDEDWSVTKYANSINDKMGQLLENVGWPHDGMSVTGFLDSILSALDKGGSWSESDKGALFAKLDGISDRLSIEAGKTVLDTIFGDMSLDATDAAASAVGSAIQNAFPFCVPAVLKQILGLLQADPAPPEFHFDFWGSPLDFGFSDWQGLADMTSWLSRIGFAVVLFANSRRFVYSGGVAGD